MNSNLNKMMLFIGSMFVVVVLSIIVGFFATKDYRYNGKEIRFFCSDRDLEIIGKTTLVHVSSDKPFVVYNEKQKFYSVLVLSDFKESYEADMNLFPGEWKARGKKMIFKFSSDNPLAIKTKATRVISLWIDILSGFCRTYLIICGDIFVFSFIIRIIRNFFYLK